MSERIEDFDEEEAPAHSFEDLLVAVLRALVVFADTTAPAVLLIAPLLFAIRSGELALGAPVALLAVALFAAVGTLLGAWSRLATLRMRATVIALAGILAAEVFSGPGGLSWPWLAGGFALLLALSFAAGRYLGTMSFLVGLVLVAVALACPPADPPLRWDLRTEKERPGAGASELPIVVHILLEAQIGVEGLSPQIDAKGAEAAALRAFYEELGFRVYGRTFATSHRGAESTASAFNFELGPPRRELLAFRGDGARRRQALRMNAYFAELSDRGYALIVHQSEALDFCSFGGSDESMQAVRCETHPLERMAALGRADLPIGEQLEWLLRIYTTESTLLEGARLVYNAFATSRMTTGLGIPLWGGRPALTSLRSPDVLEALADDLEDARPGDFYFAHVGLPAGPFVYDEACLPRAEDAAWLSEPDLDEVLLGAQAERMRAMRYARYLAQASCLREQLAELLTHIGELGLLERSRIIVQGSRGSGLTRVPMDAANLERLGRPDQVDAFSAHLAVREPGGQAHYDDRIISLPAALMEIVFGPDHDRAAQESLDRQVYVHDVQVPGRTTAHPMPTFRGGVVHDE